MTFDACKALNTVPATVKGIRKYLPLKLPSFFINRMSLVDDDVGEPLKNFSQAVAWSDLLSRKMPLTLV